MADKPTAPAPAPDKRAADRKRELARQAEVADAVHDATHDAKGKPTPLGMQLLEPLAERDSARHVTDAIGSVRASAENPRMIEGIAIPYATLSGPTESFQGSGEIIREAWTPGAFRDSVARWSDRQDGARMAFRPRHGAPPVGTVQAVTDAPEHVAFRASIFDTPAGDDYLREVAAGLNGISVEVGVPEGSRKLRDGTVLHRTGSLVAIAGSDHPAYDGARIALRDLSEGDMNKCATCGADITAGVAHTCASTAPAAAAAAPAAAPAADPPVAARDGAATGAGELVLVPRNALEQAGIAALGLGARITRPELVYSRTGEHTYLRDSYLATRGDAEAGDRQRRHGAWLHELAGNMERDAYSRIFDPGVAERAGDVLSTEIPGAYPTDFVPGLLTPRILKGRPMGSFYQRIPVADARPRTFPKVTTSTTVAVQSAEGAALSSTDLATTAVTVTPLMYGAFTDVSRQALDGGDPSVLAIIYQDLIEAYAQASETVIKTAVEAGSSASGVAITAATPWAGELANVVGYYGTRFVPCEGAFIPSALYSVLLAQGDTTGRPFMPMIGQQNSDGSVRPGGIAGDILGATAKLSYASTANVNVFGVPSDFVIFESAIAQFQYDQVVGPQAVRVGLYAYLVVGTRLGSLKVTAA
jgi:hypothetical protein